MTSRRTSEDPAARGRRARRGTAAPWRALARAAIVAAALGGCAGPDEGPDLLERAEAASRTRQWEDAAELWHDVLLGSGGRDKRACFETARAMYLSGDPPGACAMLRRGLEVHPNDVELLELSGRIQLECGFRRAAELSYARLVELDPERAAAWLALGRLRLELGQERAAIEPLGRYIALSGGDVEGYTLLGDVHRLTGQPLLAFAAYSRASDLGDLPVETAVQAAALAFDPAVRTTRTDAFSRAESWLRHAVEVDPQALRAHFLLGRLDEDEGREAEAVVHYRRAIEIDPGDLESLTRLAVLYAQSGDVGLADIVGRALAIEPSPARRAALMELLAASGDGR